MLSNVVKVEIERFLRNPDFKKIFDKKLYGGFKKYFEFIVEYEKDSVMIFIKNPKCKRFINLAGQKKVISLIKTYNAKINSIDDGVKKRFITDSVVVGIYSFLKLLEINSVIGDVESERDGIKQFINIDSLGFTGVFSKRMITALEMMEDLDDNFDMYVSANPVVADCKYIEVGLRRLMASEVDEVV